MSNIDYTKLKNYLKSLNTKERMDFAKKCNTTLGYMYKRISLKKPFGYEIAKKIHQDHIMQPRELRPTDWKNFNWK